MYIRINNTNIPVDDDFSARLEHVSAVFQDEILTGQYTFPFEISITKELAYATTQLTHVKKKLADPDNETELDCAIIDGGIQRYKGKIRFTGRNGRKMRAELTLGISKLYDWMKATRLRDVDLGTVTLNATTVQKYVVFEFAEPISGTANTGNFGIGFSGYFTVPFNTNMATTIADFVTDFNGSSWASIDDVTASQPAANQLRFDANEEGGMFPFDYSGSIAGATLPTYLGDPWTVTIDDHFNYTGYMGTIATAVTDMNENFDDGNNRLCVFPLVKNPNFIDEEVDLLSGIYCGYLNYPNPAEVTMKPSVNNTDFPWRYHLVPFPVVYEVLKACFDSQGYYYGDDFSKNSFYEYVIMYCNRPIDQPYSLTTYQDTMNIWKGVFNINEHVPDITVFELVTALKKWQNLSLTVDDAAQQVYLLRNDAIVSNYNVNNSANREMWDDFEEVDTDSEEWDLPAANGMKLAFTQDGDDDVYEERVKDRNGYEELTPVATYNDLPNFGEQNQLIMVEDQNQYYRWNGADWEYYSELLDDYATEDGEKAISTEAGIVPMTRDTESVETLYTAREWFIPYCKQVGDHLRNNGEFTPNKDYSLRFMYWRHSVTLAGPPYGYWLANNHYLDPYSSHAPFNESAHWYGDKGRYARDYERWYKLQKHGRLLYVDFLLPFARQVALNPLKWIWCNGKRLLPRRIIMPLPFANRVRVEAHQRPATVLTDES